MKVIAEDREEGKEQAGGQDRPGTPRGQGLSSARPALGIFLLGALVSGFYAFVIYPHQNMIDPAIDVNGFGQLGRHIANGEGFSLGYGPTIRRAPLYPVLVAFLVRLFGNTGPEAQVYRPVLCAQCLIVGLSCMTAWAMARKLFGARTGLAAGILCAITPQTYRYVGMTEVETTMGLLIALMALTGLNLYREPTVRNGALFGLASAAATLVKPVALLYPFVFLPLLWWNWRGQKAAGSRQWAVGTKEQAESRRQKTADGGQRAGGSGQEAEGGGHTHAYRLLPTAYCLLAALGVFLLCLLPWSVRNMIVTGGQFKGVSSNAPGEFLRGYVNVEPKYVFLRQDFGSRDPKVMMWDWEANLYEDRLLRQHGLSAFSTERFGPHGEPMHREDRVDLELSKDKVEGAEVKRRLLHEPLDFVRKFVLQLFTFWYVVDTRKKSLVVGGIALLALGLAGFGWLRARQNRIATFPVVGVVLYFNLLYAAILAFARYSMPVFPTLLVMSAYGLTQLWFPRHTLEKRGAY